MNLYLEEQLVKLLQCIVTIQISFYKYYLILYSSESHLLK